MDQFYQDPYIRTAEAERLVSQIVTALHKIKNVFIILTSRFTDNQIEFPALSRIVEIRDKKEFNETKLNVSIRNNGRLKKVSMMQSEIMNWQVSKNLTPFKSMCLEYNILDLFLGNYRKLLEACSDLHQWWSKFLLERYYDYNIKFNHNVVYTVKCPIRNSNPL